MHCSCACIAYTLFDIRITGSCCSGIWNVTMFPYFHLFYSKTMLLLWCNSSNLSGHVMLFLQSPLHLLVFTQIPYIFETPVADIAGKCHFVRVEAHMDGDRMGFHERFLAHLARERFFTRMTLLEAHQIRFRIEFFSGKCRTWTPVIDPNEMLLDELLLHRRSPRKTLSARIAREWLYAGVDPVSAKSVPHKCHTMDVFNFYEAMK